MRPATFTPLLMSFLAAFASAQQPAATLGRPLASTAVPTASAAPASTAPESPKIAVMGDSLPHAEARIPSEKKAEVSHQRRRADITEFKDLAAAISDVTTAVAIVLGGIWAYWKFSIQRERDPRAEFDLAAEFVGQQDGKWLIEVSARLTNKGKVRHPMTDATMNVRYLLSSDAVVESQDPTHFRQLSFPHAVGRRKIWQDSYIDPGLEFRNSYIIWVPAQATYVLLLCKFRYDDEEWPAQRLVKVPSRPRAVGLLERLIGPDVSRGA